MEGGEGCRTEGWRSRKRKIDTREPEGIFSLSEASAARSFDSSDGGSPASGPSLSDPLIFLLALSPQTLGDECRNTRKYVLTDKQR